MEEDNKQCFQLKEEVKERLGKIFLLQKEKKAKQTLQKEKQPLKCQSK
jgi:hypothetical protein